MDEEKQEKVQETESAARENAVKILLVDDDAFLRDMYVKKFKDGSFDVKAFAGVDAALEEMRAGYKPDILVTDLIMPSKTGWNLIEIAKKEGLAEGATLVVLTNESNTEENAEDREKFAVNGYIVKSMATPSEVVKAVIDIHTSKK